MKRNLLALLCSLFVFAVNAQLPDFSISITKDSDENCPNSGAIHWDTSGLVAGATATYVVKNAANNTIVATLGPATSYVSLVAGSYYVVGTESLDPDTKQSTSNTVVIANNLKPLAYTVTGASPICGNDGQITVNVTNGTPPYKYQLLDSSNNPTTEQDTPVFQNLASGTYTVRVKDQCGIGYTQQVTLLPSAYQISSISPIYNGSDCSTVAIGLQGLPTTLKYPFTFTVDYTDPITSNPVHLSQTITSGQPTLNIPRYAVDSVVLNYTVTDGCSNTITKTQTLHFSEVITPGVSSTSCGGYYASIAAVDADGYLTKVPFKVTFTSPAGFDQSLYDAQYDTYQTAHYYGGENNTLPPGTYNYTTTDICGNTTTGSFTVNSPTPPTINSTISNECDATTSSALTVKTDYYHPFDTVQIISGPAAFTSAHSLPYTVPDGQYILVNGRKTSFILNELPLGDYEFSYTTTCDSTVRTFTVTNSLPVVPLPTGTVQTNCSGQFQVSIPGSTDYFYIQKYDEATGKWGTATALYTPGSGQNVNNFSYMYSHDSQGVYITAPAGPGKYRLILNGSSYYGTSPNYHYNYYNVVNNNVVSTIYCAPVVLQEFTINKPLALENAYSFKCSNNFYDVVVQASGGSGTYSYSIVSDTSNTATTLVDNGTNPIFKDLAASVYYFRVTDDCGNFITRKLDVAQLGKPGIRILPDCANNALSLTVDGLDFLSYKWYKTTDPATVLSTNHTLVLGPFDPSMAGTYAVNIYTTDAAYCINTTQYLQITSTPFTAVSAGTGQSVTVTYDAANPKLNLFDYVTGPYDGFGTWTETTVPASNLLVDNIWNAANASEGTYTFLYTVVPPCGGTTKTTTVTIKLIKGCYKLPVITAGVNNSINFGITTLGRAGAANSDNWPMVRKGGWMAMESKTKGFVVNRVAFNPDGTPKGIPAANYVEGMMVYDTTNNCLKIYDGTQWGCLSKQSCPN